MGTPQSKISRLPSCVREELNRRMENGELGPTLLPWLNSLPEVQAVLQKHFNGVEVSSQNLSTWRDTGFEEWRDRQRELDFVKSASEFSREAVAATGLHLTEGAAAIAAGGIMARLEELRRQLRELDGELDTKETLEKREAITAAFDSAIASLGSLRGGEIARANLEVIKDRQALRREQHALNKERLDLEREKFETIACNALLKHASSADVQKIVSGPGTHSEKIAALRARMFPKRPDSEPEPPA
jgi:hypothetical protein